MTDMTEREILHRAASMICGANAYSAHARCQPCLATERVFHATGALEHSARRLKSGSRFLGAPSAHLADAKAAVCRLVGYPHIDEWEARETPSWDDVRQVFRQAAA